MKFTYGCYDSLLTSIEEEGYSIANFHNYRSFSKPCILRHDVDMSIKKALELASFEAKRMQPVKSTYFVLLRTDFYNPFSCSSVSMLRDIVSLGHEIGLHFDEKAYQDGDERLVFKRVENEVRILTEMLDNPITVVSMHRPSQKTLEADYQFKGVVNTYSSLFFREFKYISDSRCNWREDPFEVVCDRDNTKLQIVTHPIWYSREESNARERLLCLLKQSLIEKYDALVDNVRELHDFVKKEDLLWN